MEILFEVLNKLPPGGEKENNFLPHLSNQYVVFPPWWPQGTEAVNNLSEGPSQAQTGSFAMIWCDLTTAKGLGLPVHTCLWSQPGTDTKCNKYPLTSSFQAHNPVHVGSVTNSQCSQLSVPIRLHHVPTGAGPERRQHNHTDLTHTYVCQAWDRHSNTAHCSCPGRAQFSWWERCEIPNFLFYFISLF